MTVHDRVVNNALYDAMADGEDFEFLFIHTTQVPSGTCVDLGRNAEGLLYVRAHTSQADKDNRQRAYVYQADEGGYAATHFHW